jgi:hypothetical protein
MNAGRSEAIMKPSKYCSVGFGEWNVPPAVCGFCVVAGGSHGMKHQNSYKRGLMVAERRR